MEVNFGTPAVVYHRGLARSREWCSLLKLRQLVKPTMMKPKGVYSQPIWKSATIELVGEITF
jgi:hypothetical protein